MTGLPLPDEVADLLRGFPGVDADADADEQAFPFVTVDEHGYPHSALLSRSELEPSGAVLLAVVAGARTRANLRRDGRAALLAVHGTVCHHVKLRLLRSLDRDDLLGCVFEAVSHKPDSLGIPLRPLGFRTEPEIAERERWPRTAAILAELGGAAGR
ncbi:pyridoxamine 5'-phosphate oxidase family protein [Pseudonocardia acaciae]|uniref:pyridoxamine 5'-phosphate oxidase family protein n=1 Tax=Pseudonocardia acaciae TaxID=551276 RepID=UPI00048E8261|nr:pyridoxamine 5'-phosphate oxidase family protein [Pseudonocardia acaciae]